MMCRTHYLGAVAMLGAVLSLSCDPSFTTAVDSGSDSVRDVAAGAGPSVTNGSLQWVRARIRNESAAPADISLRFVRSEEVVDSAFVRVLPATITTVATPAELDVLELSGVNDSGRALAVSTYVFGVDFDGDRPAEYVIRDTTDAAQVEPPQVTPIPTELTEIVLIEPGDDRSVVAGSAFTAAWSDEHTRDDATITLFLRPVTGEVGSNRALPGDDPAAEVPLFPLTHALRASGDGVNDRTSALVQGVAPGRYFVLARLVDGDITVWSTAPGVLTVSASPGPAPPRMRIVSPDEPVVVETGETLPVSWTDEDPGGGATIGFTLESSDGPGPAEVFDVAEGVLAGPDGIDGDSTLLNLAGVLPGVYDLVGTIRGSSGIGTDRRERIVHVRPSAENDPPQIELLEPAEDLELELDDQLHVRWAVSDANDDARISLYLDPDLASQPLDGDEVLLVSGLSEDDYGPVGSIDVAFPSGMAADVYRLVGVIADGSTQVESAAPAVLYVGREGIEPGDGGGGEGGGHGGPGGGGPGGGGPGGEGSGPDTDVQPLDPLGELLVTAARAGQFRVAATLPVNADPIPRYVLTNIDHGGDVRVELRPRGADGGECLPDSGCTGEVVTIQIPPWVVANEAWPRAFDLEIETEVDGETVVLPVGGPVWIRQEVMVGRYRMVHSPCAEGAREAVAGLEIEWYGGGYIEGDRSTTVEFWLSADGAVPGAGYAREASAGDGRHQLVYIAPVSPNRWRRLHLIWAPGMVPASAGGDTDGADRAWPSGPSVEVRPNLAEGEYRLMAVVDPLGPDRTVVDLLPESFPVCPAP